MEKFRWSVEREREAVTPLRFEDVLLIFFKL